MARALRPLKTELGWLHLAHGVRNTAAGLRYVLYVFMTDLNDLTKVIHKPGVVILLPLKATNVLAMYQMWLSVMAG